MSIAKALDGTASQLVSLQCLEHRALTRAKWTSINVAVTGPNSGTYIFESRVAPGLFLSNSVSACARW